MGKKLECPNCNGPVANHPENGCILAALIQVIRDRDVMSERSLRRLHADTDIEVLWCRLGAVVDDLEEGRYRF
ncbi:MAG: hypothetical protein KDF55_02185 [Thauera sp.]|nr:hypothetical protein [Thauera sp.]